MKNMISWFDFSFWGNEKSYVNEALDSTWVSGGTYIEKFEKELEKKLNLPNAFVVSNGTAALQLAFLTIELHPGDEVIVPAYGFMAAANVLKLMNVTPVFVDVDEYHWCISSAKIKNKITNKTKAIVVIHNYGVIAEINEIAEIARNNNLYLIEDCAEATFSKYNNKYCGTFGDLSTFSFHATKTISTGEGGMVSCKDPILADRLKLIRSHGLRRDKVHYWHEYFGNNFRMSNILAAIGFGQLEMISDILVEKSRVLSRYKSNLSDISGIHLQGYHKETNPVIWAVAIYINPDRFQISRDDVMRKMGDIGIECRPGFYTPNQLDIYKNLSTSVNVIANKLAENIIVLPSSPRLKDSQIDFITESLIKIIKDDQINKQ